MIFQHSGCRAEDSWHREGERWRSYATKRGDDRYRYRTSTFLLCMPALLYRVKCSRPLVLFYSDQLLELLWILIKVNRTHFKYLCAKCFASGTLAISSFSKSKVPYRWVIKISYYSYLWTYDAPYVSNLAGMSLCISWKIKKRHYEHHMTETHR